MKVTIGHYEKNNFRVELSDRQSRQLRRLAKHLDIPYDLFVKGVIQKGFDKISVPANKGDHK